MISFTNNNFPVLTIKIPQSSFREEIEMPLFISKNKYPELINNLQRQCRYLFDKLFTCEIEWSDLCSNTFKRLLSDFEQEEKIENNNYYILTKQNFFITKNIEESFYFFMYYINCYYENKNK